MKWQCSYIDSAGTQCTNEALYRLHFSGDHPFDHTDVCRQHLEEYSYFVWTQDLTLDGKERSPC